MDIYNYSNEDILEAKSMCNNAFTIKGQKIGYMFLYSGKDIENRTRKIKPGWYCIHIGCSKKPNVSKDYLNLVDNYDEKYMPPRSSIIGCVKIEGVENNTSNKWFIGPIGNKITKIIRFKTPIIDLPGHQSITYNLKTIDKKLIKKNKFKTPVKNLINQELDNLLK